MAPKLKQPQPTHAPVVQPAIARSASVRTRSAEPAVEETVFDPTRTIELELRHVIPGVGKVLADKSPQRPGMIAFAANDFARTLDEVCELARRRPPTWKLLDTVVEAAAGAHARLAPELHDASATDLEQAWQRFSAITSIAATRSSAPLRALDNDQLAELALQLTAAAAARLEIVIEGAFDDASIDAACTAVTLDLQCASDAAASITDRRLRTSLGTKCGGLWARLEKLEAMLVTPPKKKWQPSIAHLFDAELFLRPLVGEKPIARRYAGDVNPDIAKSQIMDLASASRSSPPACDLEAPDPHTAVDAIMIDLASLYDVQVDAITRLQRDLGIKDVPETSVAGALLAFIITEVFNIVGVHVGNALSAAFGRALSRGREATLGSNEYLSRLLQDPAVKRQMLASAFKSGPTWHAFAGETAKQLAKDTFKLPGDALGTAVKKQFAEPSSRDHVTQYCDTQKALLTILKRNTLLTANYLRPALLQLDLSTLNDFASQLCTTLPKQVDDLRYSEAMRGWLRFEAEAGSNGKQTIGHGRNESPSGVVETTISAQNGDLTFHRMRMTGDRTQARVYLHRARIALPSADQGVYARFQLACYWGAGGHKDVFFAVPPNGNVDVDSFDADELVLLRALVGGGRIDDRTIAASRDGEYSSIPNVIDRVMATIRAMKLTTELVEAA